MPNLPLSSIRYEDEQNAVIDKLNDNFRQLEWLLNFANFGTDNIKASAITIGSDSTFDAGYDPSAKETPTGAQTKADAAVAGLEALLGGLAYDDLVEKAKLGTTVIVGGYLVTDLIQAGSIVASKLSVSTLSAITANLGTVTAGTITIDTDLTVGNSINVGSQGSSGTQKRLNFHTSTYWQGLNGQIKGVCGSFYVDTSYGDFYIDNTGANFNGVKLWVGELQASSTVTLNGSVDLTSATVTGLSAASGGSHNHGITDGTMLALASGGSVQWVAYTGHTHTVS